MCVDYSCIGEHRVLESTNCNSQQNKLTHFNTNSHKSDSTRHEHTQTTYVASYTRLSTAKCGKPGYEARAYVQVTLFRAGVEVLHWTDCNNHGARTATKVSGTSVPSSKMLRCMGRVWHGWGFSHIKAFKPHPIPHQSDVFTKGVRGQYALVFPRENTIHTYRSTCTYLMASSSSVLLPPSFSVSFSSTSLASICRILSLASCSACTTNH